MTWKYILSQLQMEDGDEIDAILYDKSRRINLKVTGQVSLFLQFFYLFLV
jgi:hypothetical protein